MKVDRDLVQRVAHLAQIELAEDEIPFYEKQMQDFLTFVDEIQSLSISDFSSGQFQAIGDNREHSLERADVVLLSLPTEFSMSNAPKASGTSFEVPRIIE